MPSASMRSRNRPRPDLVASPSSASRAHVNVSSPSREERAQRRRWAEVGRGSHHISFVSLHT